MQDLNRIREGMTVYSADGTKLGKVVRSDASGIIIEKGIFFIKDYLARHEDVATIEEDDVRLAVNREGLQKLDEDEVAQGSAGARGVGAIDAPDAGITPRGFDTATLGGLTGASTADPDEVRVPVIEEELVANKTLREAGEVVIRKEVHTEHKTIDVPVLREEVHVERRAVNQPATGEVGDFRDETIRMPIREEEVEITKRPVVREEVRVTRTAHAEERAAEGTVRREEVEVDDTRQQTRRDDDKDKFETCRISVRAPSSGPGSRRGCPPGRRLR